MLTRAGLPELRRLGPAVDHWAAVCAGVIAALSFETREARRRSGAWGRGALSDGGADVQIAKMGLLDCGAVVHYGSDIVDSLATSPPQSRARLCACATVQFLSYSSKG